MPRLTHSVPSYRLHKPSGRAVVTLNGTDHYLGACNSPDSRPEYDRLISEWLAARGHGVGFAAIDHNARPRLHPQSPDLVQEGMVLNVEPAMYLEGVDGMRHCDMIEVTPTAAAVLTRFLDRRDQLVLTQVRTA